MLCILRARIRAGKGMVGQMSQTATADRVLDCTGLLCPMPIVKLSRTIKEMSAGQVLLMEATDPGSIPDVVAWSENTGQDRKSVV